MIKYAIAISVLILLAVVIVLLGIEKASGNKSRNRCPEGEVFERGYGCRPA